MDSLEREDAMVMESWSGLHDKFAQLSDSLEAAVQAFDADNGSEKVSNSCAFRARK